MRYTYYIGFLYVMFSNVWIHNSQFLPQTLRYILLSFTNRTNCPPPPEEIKKTHPKQIISDIVIYIFTYVQWYTTHFTHTTGTGFPVPHTDVSIQDGRGLPLSCTALLVNHFDHQFIQLGRITCVWKHSGTSGLINKSENCVLCFTHNLFPNALHM